MPAPATTTPSPNQVRTPATTPRPVAAAPAVQSPLRRGRAGGKKAQPAAFQSPYLARLLGAFGKSAAPSSRPRLKRPAAAPAGATEAAVPEAPKPPAGETLPRAPRTPSEDPLFQRVRGEVRTEASRQRRHAPASRKRTEAEAASALEKGEQETQNAKETNTAEMERVGSAQHSQASRFSAEGFKQDLMKRVNAKRPRDEGEAKALAKQPPLENFEQEFSGKVAQEQGNVTGPLDQKAVPNPGGGKADKPEASVPKPVAPPAAKAVEAQRAAPKPKAWWEISRKKESDKLDSAMSENRLSEQQLEDSREPSFVETLKLKREAQKKAAEAPDVYRQREAAILETAQARADKSLASGLEGMNAVHRRAGAQVFGGQQKTETRTEKRQREIKTTIDNIYEGTVKAVKAILEGMAKQVKEDFAKALKEKTEEFNKEVARRISDYYGDWRIDDDLFGPADVIVNDDGSTRPMTLEEKFGGRGKRINPDVYRIFVQEKDKFLRAMDAALDVIANNVQAGLTAAHNQIKFGESSIAIFKASLQGAELEYAESLEQEVKMKFESLEASIDDTREDLLQTLADQYSESVDQLEKTFNEINDELKKGWLERAAEFIKTVGKTIFQLADLLFTILVRMARLVWDIVKHPIRFFETLVAGLMQGIGKFISNIGTYLQEAFWTWITGATPAKNIRLTGGSGPESLFGVVLQVLSLTPADLRAIAEKVLGKEFMQLLDKGEQLVEKALEPVTILLTKGPLALWEYIKDSVASMIRSTFDRIRESVFNTFVEKGLKWIAGFFIPGGGFVKVVKAVFRAFQFVVENLERIRHFFDSVFDSMEAATQGKTDGVASKIIAGLKIGVVLALDFLAKQLGMDKIVDGVQKIIQSLRRPIVSAIEWLLTKLKPFVTKVVTAVASKVKAGISKVVSFVFPRKKLTLQDGTHTMEVEPETQGYEIAVYSNRMRISQIIAKARRDKLDKAQTDALEDKYKEWRAMPKPQDPETEKKAYAARSQKYEEIYRLSIPLLEKIFGADEVTKITWGGIDSLGRATRVQANPLTKKGAKGSAPREAIPGHDTNLRYGGEYISYIRTHLLHHDLGGPGRSFNLTPTSNSVNQLIFNRVEEQTLKEVQKGEVLIYTCNVEYKDSPSATELAKVKPDSKQPLLKFSARRIAYNVTYKGTGKYVVPRFDEENWK
jgi:hypothetical protein